MISKEVAVKLGDLAIQQAQAYAHLTDLAEEAALLWADLSTGSPQIIASLPDNVLRLPLRDTSFELHPSNFEWNSEPPPGPQT